MFDWENPFQNLFRNGSEKNCKSVVTEVTDEVKFPDYVDVSEEAKDFILRCLKKKPEERMEIREMIRHPFINKYRDKKPSIDIAESISRVLNG